MKYAKAIAAGAVALGLTGCATASKMVVQDPVGPCHKVQVAGANNGSLQVYSARERAPTDLNMEEFLWNNDFGRNEFLYEPAHTDYTIYTKEGRAFKHVRNSRGPNDGNPAVVELPPGEYTIEAEAEESGGITTTVKILAVVETGQITAVHLEPRSERPGEAPTPDRIVGLDDGRVIGCRAHHAVSQRTSAAAATGAGADLAGTR